MRSELNQLLARYPAPTTSPDAGNASGLGTDVLEKLRSLGYVAYKAPAAPTTKLADPKDKLPIFQDVLRATDLVQAGHFAAARSLLASLQKREAQLYLIPFLLGEASSREARWKEAEKNFARSAELNPGFDQATMGLARALGFQGKTREARDLINTLLAANPGNFRAWFLLAQIQAKDEPKLSLEALDKVLSIQPNFAPAYRDRGLLLVHEGTYRSAAEDLVRAVELGMRDRLTYNFLGICYSRMNRLEDAVENYRRAISADPNYAEAHLNLGFAYERMNELDLSKKEYAEACRLEHRVCALIARH
jgi:tetratricopeptide (TPR) repeat protein